MLGRATRGGGSASRASTPLQQRGYYADDASCYGNSDDEEGGRRRGTRRVLTLGETNLAPSASRTEADAVMSAVKEDRARLLKQRRAFRADDSESASESEPDSANLCTRVFALDREAAREARRKRKAGLCASTAQQEPPATPSATRHQIQPMEITTSARKNVSFNPDLVGPATPSKRGASHVSTPLKRSLRASSTATPQHQKKPQNEEEEVTPARSTRASRATRASSTAPTPKGRTPDAKLAARQRVAEILHDSESSDSDGEEDEEDDEDDDEFGMDDPEARLYGTIDESDIETDPLAAISPAAELKDLPVAASKFRQRESDFDRDVKRRGAVRANIEDYFTESMRTKGPAKAQTSNNTLASLPTLSREEFLEALESMPQKHVNERKMLADWIPSHFAQWEYELSMGFNLMLFGYGSKRSVLNQFKEKYCRHGPVLTLNGYMPVVNIATDVLAKLTAHLIPPTSTAATNTTTIARASTTATSQIAAIASYFQQPARTHTHLYLLIHNLDGPALRSPAQQRLLAALLRTVPRGCIRVLATLDHIAAPLLWDRETCVHVLWKEVSTFAGYEVETGHEGMVFVEGGGKGGVAGAQGVGGALHVLRSLNQNARRMFRILADLQVAEAEAEPVRKRRRGVRACGGEQDNEEEEEHEKDKGKEEGQIEGMSYNTFLTRCIESFCVNSQDNFKAQLAEFRDHRLILSRRGAQGEETLYIPFDAVALRGLLGQLTF
ncbi:origin recognition complex subunit 2-domain-containing protein [Chytriomyces sp. MP71]|nr:origin recognition complex subunit 2-domain-containing protein [Chytriomyces sp. MP71]